MTDYLTFLCSIWNETDVSIEIKYSPTNQLTRLTCIKTRACILNILLCSMQGVHGCYGWSSPYRNVNMILTAITTEGLDGSCLAPDKKIHPAGAMPSNLWNISNSWIFRFKCRHQTTNSRTFQSSNIQIEMAKGGRF